MVFLLFQKTMLKKDILRNKDDFTRIYKKGKSIGDRYIVLFYRKNHLSYKRIAFLASKKVGNSVKRNRARRLMRESYRSLGEQMKDGYDIIFIARNSINDRKMQEVDRSMRSAVKKAKLYK